MFLQSLLLSWMLDYDCLDAFYFGCLIIMHVFCILVFATQDNSTAPTSTNKKQNRAYRTAAVTPLQAATQTSNTVTPEGNAPRVSSPLASSCAGLASSHHTPHGTSPATRRISVRSTPARAAGQSSKRGKGCLANKFHPAWQKGKPSQKWRSGQDPFTEAPKDTFVNGSKTCYKQIDTGHMNVEGLASKLCEPDFLKIYKVIILWYILCSWIYCTCAILFQYTLLWLCYVSFSSKTKNKKQKNKSNKTTTKKVSKHGRRSGGVAVLIHKTVMSFVTHIDCEHDIICFKLAKDAVGSDRDLLIISVYVPPYLSPYYR